MGRRYTGGYLSVYVSLTLLVMLSLCLTLIEGARRSGTRLETECAVDIGLNSIMAEYHRELFNQYNLFYIDSSYGTSVPSYCNTQYRLQYYIEENLNTRKNDDYMNIYEDFLGLELLDSYVDRVSFATDDNGIRFQKKAAQVMLDEVGLGYVEDILTVVGIVEKNKLTEFNLEEERLKVSRQIEEVVGEKDEEGNFEMPMDYVSELSGQGILMSVTDGEDISNQKVDLSHYISERRKSGALNCGNASTQESISLAEIILFHEYLINHAGCYGREKEGSLLKYQVEYVLFGTDSDRENLARTLSSLFLIRGAANVIHLYSDAIKMGAVRTAAFAVTFLLPEIEPLVEVALVLGWAYVESIYDLKVLLAGGKVPLLKSSGDWHYDLGSIMDSVDLDVKDTNQSGLRYKDYLHILLYFASSEKMTFRFMDLMEMDIRATEGNAAFRMDGCIEWISVGAVVKARSGYTHSVRAQMGYE